MNTEYIYKAYDLIFSSEIKIPELQRSGGNPDVEIRLGSVPEALEQPKDSGAAFQASDKEFLLKIKDVAAFYIKDGNSIVIQPFEGSSELDVRIFLLGSVFGALLQQRGYLVLHGAALQVNGQGVLLTGRAGIGKSTLASAFHQKGYSVLTDDVCAVIMGDDGTPYIVPGFPSLKLWKDAAERMGRNVEGLIPVRKSMDKFRVDIDAQFCQDHIPLHRVYVLLNTESEKLELKELAGINKLKALIKNSYRYKYLHGQGMRELHFRQCAAVSNQVSVFCIFRNKAIASPEEIADLIEATTN